MRSPGPLLLFSDVLGLFLNLILFYDINCSADDWFCRRLLSIVVSFRYCCYMSLGFFFSFCSLFGIVTASSLRRPYFAPDSLSWDFWNKLWFEDGTWRASKARSGWSPISMLYSVVSSSPARSFRIELRSAICSNFINYLACSISELASLFFVDMIARLTWWIRLDSPYDFDCFSSLPTNLFSLSIKPIFLKSSSS